MVTNPAGTQTAFPGRKRCDDQRMTAIMDTRMAMNESKRRSVWPKWSKLIHTMLPTKGEASTSKKLRAWQTVTILSEQSRYAAQSFTTARMRQPTTQERILPASVDQNPHRHLAAQPSTWSNANLAWNHTARRRFNNRSIKQ
jgi:hypothetical protein